MEKPSIIIVVEGGAVINVATTGPPIIYRIIDLDVMKTQETCFQNDCGPDATGVDPEEYTDMILKDAGWNQ